MIYGTKPPTPRSAFELTRWLKEQTTLDIKVLDMGPGQEYRFGGEATEGWVDRDVQGITQLKQLSYDEWLHEFLDMQEENEGAHDE